MRYVKSNEEKFIHFKIKSNEQPTHPLFCELDRRNEAKQQPFYCCATALEMPQPCKPQTLTMASTCGWDSVKMHVLMDHYNCLQLILEECHAVTPNGIRIQISASQEGQTLYIKLKKVCQHYSIKQQNQVIKNYEEKFYYFITINSMYYFCSE